MSVGEICNRMVVIIGKEDTVIEAARLMRRHHVGSLVVVEEREGKRYPVGVLTDRDIVVEIIAEEVSVEKLLVGDVMSFDPVTVREDMGVSETIKLMRDKGIRRIPVVDAEGAVAGILTVDDVIDLLAEELADLSRLVSREQERERETRR